MGKTTPLISGNSFMLCTKEGLTSRLATQRGVDCSYMSPYRNRESAMSNAGIPLQYFDKLPIASHSLPSHRPMDPLFFLEATRQFVANLQLNLPLKILPLVAGVTSATMNHVVLTLLPHTSPCNFETTNCGRRKLPRITFSKPAHTSLEALSRIWQRVPHSAQLGSGSFRRKDQCF